jgi:hypothetical protein
MNVSNPSSGVASSGASRWVVDRDGRRTYLISHKIDKDGKRHYLIRAIPYRDLERSFIRSASFFCRDR